MGQVTKWLTSSKVKSKSNDMSDRKQAISHICIHPIRALLLAGGFQLWLLCAHAASNDGPPRHSEYGWAVYGNNSLNDRDIMARTDMDNSSVTYGLWTPPDDWKEKCMRSYGFPITACSYHMAQEFPGFMKAFWVLFFLFYSVGFLSRCMYILFYFGECYVFCKVNGRNLPQHIKKADAKGANVVCIHNVFWAIAAVCYIPWFKSFYCFFGNGIGLIHSLPTGVPYLGADWNNNPVPDINDLKDLQWYSTMLPQEWSARGLVYLSTPNGHWHSTFSGSLGLNPMEDDIHDKFYWHNLSFFAALYALFSEEGDVVEFNPMLAAIIFIVHPPITEWPIKMDGQITLHPEPRGDEDIRKWLIGNSAMNRTLVMFLGFHTLFIALMIVKMWKTLVKAAAVSAAGSSMALRKTRFLVNGGGYAIAHVLIIFFNICLLPNGAMLQVHGLYKPFTDSNDKIWGSSEQDPHNMLCAPICRLVMVIVLNILEVLNFSMCTPYSPPNLYKRKLPEYAPKSWRWLFPRKFIQLYMEH